MLLFGGCNLLGPHESFDGNWVAPGPGITGSSFGLSLSQSGDTIRGAACFVESGVKVYSGAPVTGDYPHIRVVVTAASTPCCPWIVGQEYTATMEKRGEIVMPNGIRFHRVTTPACP
ncbi:MAG: hypothetical protein R2745_09920 [Vicinamibacterales bacterium]